MANPDHLARLKGSVLEWNEWREKHPTTVVDLSNAFLSGASYNGRNLRGVNLNWSNLSGAKMRGANLFGAHLYAAYLIGADLTEVDMREADLRNANLGGANLAEASIRDADLREARLCKANLTKASLGGADMRAADLAGADLRGANLLGTLLLSNDPNRPNLSHNYLNRTDLTEANLSGADLSGVDLSYATLREANLTHAKLSETRLIGANLLSADFRSATLQFADLSLALATDIKLWETQRAGWRIKGILCERAFWDEEATDRTAYAPGEFERLYCERTSIELVYPGGISTFELSTLPALLQHLTSSHRGANIRLKSIEETGGGAKISISVGDSNAESVEKIKGDALRIYRAQLALRETDVERLRIENDLLNKQNDKLIGALLTASAPHNTFHAPVYGPVFASGNARVEMHQTVDNSAGILALLEAILERRGELSLGQADSNLLRAEVDSAKTELAKPDPSPSLLSRSLKLIQKLAGEAVSKAAEKLGEQAVSADWSSWLHQLNQYLLHLK